MSAAHLIRLSSRALAAAAVAALVVALNLLLCAVALYLIHGAPARPVPHAEPVARGD